MNYDEWLDYVLMILPNAEVSADNYGQLVIYTDLMLRGSTVVDFELGGDNE